MDPSMHQMVDSAVGDGEVDSALDAEGYGDDGLANSKTHRDDLVSRKRIWRIPATAPKFLNMPIALVNDHTEPQKGTSAATVWTASSMVFGWLCIGQSRIRTNAF